jgi:hypothetical protein
MWTRSAQQRARARRLPQKDGGGGEWIEVIGQHRIPQTQAKKQKTKPNAKMELFDRNDPRTAAGHGDRLACVVGVALADGATQGDNVRIVADRAAANEPNGHRVRAGLEEGHRAAVRPVVAVVQCCHGLVVRKERARAVRGRLVGIGVAAMHQVIIIIDLVVVGRVICVGSVFM